MTDPESSHRDFSVAQIQILDAAELEKEQINSNLCTHCSVLLKRCMYLTNQLFLHDHAACREENAQLSAEVTKLRAIFKDTGGGGSGNEELQATIKRLEYDLKTKVAKVEAEKRQAVETIKAQMRGLQDDAAKGGVGGIGGLNLDSDHEVQRYKTELERVRKERDNLKVSLFRHEKKEVDYLNLLAEHESRKTNYETYRNEIEIILAQKESEKLACEEEISILAKRVQELESQWHSKQLEEQNIKSMEEKFHLSISENQRLLGVQAALQKQVESLRDFEYLYKDATNRLRLMEKDVSLTNEYQSALKESQMRCGLLEKEVRNLRGWETKYHELNQKLIVLEKQNTNNKEWESKWTHLDAQFKHTVTKVNELSAMLADHQDCEIKLEEAKRDAQRALRSAEMRRKIQEDARSLYSTLKPQLGCEFQDHKLGAIISKLRENTPAARAGLQVKDIIVSAGGESVSNRAGMVKACMRYAPGDVLPLALIRGKNKAQLQAEVEVGASGLNPEDVRELKRKLEGRITEEDINRLFAATMPMPNIGGAGSVAAAIAVPSTQQQQQSSSSLSTSSSTGALTGASVSSPSATGVLTTSPPAVESKQNA